MFLIYREVFDNYTKFQGRLQRAYCQELCLWSFRWIFGVEASGLSKSCPKKIVSLYNNNSNTNDLLLSAFFLCFAAFWWKAEVLRAELKPQKITLGHELPCSL